MTGNQPAGSFRKLRIYNFIIGLLHLGQGVAILALSNDFSLPVHATFMEAQPGAQPASLHHLFDVQIGPAVAAFVFISAAAHFILVLPGVFGWYCRNLERRRNDARWIEYAFSASLMIVLIAMITGIGDIAALVALFGVNASMILFGLVQEHTERPGDGPMLPFWLGCIAGAVPWIAIAIYLISPGVDASPPGFVYGIFVSLFVFFNAFAVNMWLQYRRIGPWRNYQFGETVYILLSLTAKSALAWQVFAATLAG
ncbi:MAG: heliorhodopsin HeR [Tepidiformaceae bacterium]